MGTSSLVKKLLARPVKMLFSLEYLRFFLPEYRRVVSIDFAQQ
jgi:hypothetical protein